MGARAADRVRDFGWIGDVCGDTRGPGACKRGGVEPLI